MDTLKPAKLNSIDFEHIFDISPDLIFILDSEQNIIRANHALAKWAGISSDSLIGSKCFWTVHQKDKPPDFCIHSQMLKDGQEHSEEIFLQQLGGWYLLKIVPLHNEDGKITGSVHIIHDITDQRRNYESTRKSETTLLEAQRLAHIGSWQWTVLTDTVKWSEELYRINGLNPNTSVPDYHELLSKYSTESREKLEVAMRKAVKDGASYELILESTLPDGSTRYNLTHGEADFDGSGKVVGLHGTVQDITQFKQLEDALRESKEKYQAIFECTGTATLIVDEDTTILMANNEWYFISGYTPAEIIGQKWIQYVAPDYLQEMLKNHYLRRQNPDLAPKKYDVKLINKKGEIRDATVKVDMIPGTKQSIISIFDITDHKLAEAEIKLKNKQLIKADAEKNKFFTIVAHDLRSPFNSLLGFTKLMEEELPVMTQEEIQKIAVNMRKSATGLYCLLENLLDWSRLQRGVIPYNPEPILLKSKVSADLTLTLELAIKKEIELIFNIPDDLMVFADSNMVGGIFRNFLSNAVKFTPRGGKVFITANPMPGGWIEISIRDTGIGMNNESIENLFLLDINTNRVGTEHEPSTGLGLIICKDFIEKHGGKLSIESEEGKGTTFYFTLPGKKDNM